MAIKRPYCNYAGKMKELQTGDTLYGSGSAPDWGDIGGDINNQSDLQTSLAAKAATVHLHTANQITDFDSAVTNNAAVVLNTAKVSYPGVGSVDHNSLLNYAADRHFLQTEIEYANILNTPVIPTVPIDSVFGRTGAVTAQANDYTWEEIDKTASNIADLTTRSHTSLTDKGTNTHDQIDTAVSNSVSHIANISNPHSVTAGQVGAEVVLGNPASDGYILSSSTGGVRSWIEPPAEHDPVTVTDTTSVNLTLTGQDIQATVIPGAVDHNQLLNYSDSRHFLQGDISITESQISNLQSYALDSHNHSGVYEPILGNPGTDGYVLSSTAAGVRSWVAQSGGTSNVEDGTAAGQVLFWDGSTEYKHSEVSEIIWNDTSKSLGIGATDPKAITHLKSNVAAPATIQLQRNFGTSTNAVIGSIFSQLQDNKPYPAGFAAIEFLSGGAAYYKGQICFKVNISDGTNPATPPTEIIRIDDNGYFILYYPGSTTIKTKINTDSTGKLNITPSGNGVVINSLPTSDPSNAGELWNDSGTLKVSAG